MRSRRRVIPYKLRLTLHDPFGTIMGDAVIDVTHCMAEQPEVHLAQIIQWCGQYVQRDPAGNPNMPSYINISDASERL